jgi:hypothetical protein
MTRQTRIAPGLGAARNKKRDAPTKRFDENEPVAERTRCKICYKCVAERFNSGRYLTTPSQFYDHVHQTRPFGQRRGEH